MRGFASSRRAVVSRLEMVPSGYLHYFYQRPERLEAQLAETQSRAARVMEIEAELLRLYQDPNLAEKPAIDYILEECPMARGAKSLAYKDLLNTLEEEQPGAKYRFLVGFLKEGRARPVAIWLFVVAAMVFAMVVVGGSTRLTNSGLSITEWKPLSGVIPPLNSAQWRGRGGRSFDSQASATCKTSASVYDFATCGFI